MAPEALNGDLINATRYALLSHSRAILLEQSTTSERRVEYRRELLRNELCYNGHSTMFVIVINRL